MNRIKKRKERFISGTPDDEVLKKRAERFKRELDVPVNDEKKRTKRKLRKRAEPKTVNFNRKGGLGRRGHRRGRARMYRRK
jgi:hypothetical protein